MDLIADRIERNIRELGEWEFGDPVNAGAEPVSESPEAASKPDTEVPGGDGAKLPHGACKKCDNHGPATPIVMRAGRGRRLGGRRNGRNRKSQPSDSRAVPSGVSAAVATPTLRIRISSVLCAATA
jgi:hypothetical protein